MQGSDVTVDLSGSDPQVVGLRQLLARQHAVGGDDGLRLPARPRLATNEGAFRPLKVIGQEGTVVWAREGAPVTMCTSHCSNEIIESIIVALSPACPERAMGGWGRRLRIAIDGRDPRTGRRFIWHMFQARPGGGASVAGDGLPTTGEWHSAGGIKFGVDRGRRDPLSAVVRDARIPRAVPPATASIAAATAATCGCGSKPTAPARANTAGEGVATAPAACWAARTARRTATRCRRPRRHRANCEARRSAS